MGSPRSIRDIMKRERGATVLDAMLLRHEALKYSTATPNN